MFHFASDYRITHVASTAYNMYIHVSNIITLVVCVIFFTQSKKAIVC